MVPSKSSKETSFLKGQTGWAGVSVVLSALLASQSTVALRAADTPGTTKGCSSQAFVAGDAPAPSACPDTPQTEETAQLEQRMWELINQEREDPSHLTETRGRARPLKWDEKLAGVARAHSRDMVERGYVSHFSPDGSFPALRVSQAGIAYLCAGENIAKFRDVIRAQAAFMNEPPLGHNHRANILDPDFTHVGIGIVRGPDGMFYITQEFIQRP
jgi:uncharacterized protein YkwD